MSDALQPFHWLSLRRYWSLSVPIHPRAPWAANVVRTHRPLPKRRNAATDRAITALLRPDYAKITADFGDFSEL